MESCIVMDNPILPVSLPVRLHPGYVICVEGRVPNDSERFAVNLCASEDIALHVNPRWGSVAGSGCHLVLNSRAGGAWGHEQRLAAAPLCRDTDFKLSIAVDEDGYKVLCDETQVLEFAHRCSLGSVNRLEVQPTANVTLLHVLAPVCTDLQDAVSNLSVSDKCDDGEAAAAGAAEEEAGEPAKDDAEPAAEEQAPAEEVKGSAPEEGAAGADEEQEAAGEPAPGDEEGDAAEQPAELSVPLDGAIEGGLHPGWSLILEGSVPDEANRFTVNLLREGGEDIALHVNPRFSAEGDGALVRNAKIGGAWGTEERGGPNPFARGEPFTLEVICGESNFALKVGGEAVCEFAHRVEDLASVTAFSVHGDVALAAVRHGAL